MRRAAAQPLAQAEELRLYKRIATMDASAPLPRLTNQTPRWAEAAALARNWALNALAKRLEERARPAAE